MERNGGFDAFDHVFVQGPAHFGNGLFACLAFRVTRAIEMKRIFVSMDLQTDINWIVAELKQVKDPHLIEAFKQLLIYRRPQLGEEEFEQAYERAMADKAADRAIPHPQVRAKYDKWL